MQCDKLLRVIFRYYHAILFNNSRRTDKHIVLNTNISTMPHPPSELFRAHVK